MSEREVDVVILGAGAAGLMCAIEAGRRGRRVALLDHADRPGKKILISGGGRCNFTNLHTRPENFLSENPHFAKSALARYTPANFIELVEQHNIPYHEKTLGQLFCNHSAQQIVTMLTEEAASAGVDIILGSKILTVDRHTQQATPDEPGSYITRTSRGAWRSNAVVIASGGLSIPRMGATGIGYDIARQFGLNIIECRPALVSLVLSVEDQRRWCDLSGLSAEVLAFTGTGKGTTTFREKLLITHRGLSGPVILQISSFWRPGASISVDLAPDRIPTSALRPPNIPRTPATMLGALRETLPARLAERWLSEFQPQNWTNTALDLLEQNLHRWEIRPQGTEGYAKAEVTAGGVDTAELDARTMESKRAPGLYFIGEVVDVTGWLGGYNFQWAWASGAAAGRAI